MTLLENWLEGKTGVEPYQGGFLLHYLDKLVYPDISSTVLTTAGVIVCTLNLAFHGWQFQLGRSDRSHSEASRIGLDRGWLARAHACERASRAAVAQDSSIIAQGTVLIQMASVLQTASADNIRRIRKVQTITIGWMIAEVAVSLFSAWRARSPALLAFGGDSGVELISAVVVLWRFGRGSAHELAERRAARMAGVLLFVLAAYVTVASAMSLLGYSEPKPSLMGIIILLLAAAVMPWLARQKRKLSAATGSAALRADAAQSGMCAYLASIALLGLAVNAIWRFRWAGPIAALIILPLIIWEAREAMRGKACGCC